MSVKAYKGFNADMTCRGFQYEGGKEYSIDDDDCIQSPNGRFYCLDHAPSEPDAENEKCE